MPHQVWMRAVGIIAVVSFIAPGAKAQVPRDTARLEHLFYLEIAALLCELELPDETEDRLDQAIRAQQHQLRLRERQMAAVYRQAWAKVEANQELACETVRQLDPSPVDPDE